MSRQFYLATRTHEGLRKFNNEDSFYANESKGLFLICDGMGGHGAGDIASKTAVDAIKTAFDKNSGLTDCLIEANQAVLEKSKNGEGTLNMGTTAVVAHIQENGDFEVAWVGDSRAYLLAKDGIHMLTEDHAYAYKLMQEGFISREELRFHPYRSVLLQSVGGGQEEVYPSHLEGHLDEDSVLLLCSDGLTGELEDEEILNILVASPSLEEAADILLQQTLTRGAHDNVTLVLVALQPPLNEEEKPQNEHRDQKNDNEDDSENDKTQDETTHQKTTENTSKKKRGRGRPNIKSSRQGDK